MHINSFFELLIASRTLKSQRYNYNNTMRKILIHVLLLFISTYIYSSDVKFYSVNNTYGISMRETGSICRDENGFIWTSSKTGILRLSEGDYRIYQLPYITPNAISVKLVYKKSFLYAYTNNGQLFLYDAVFDKFNLISDLRKSFKNDFLVVIEIRVQDDGALWIATSSGLYCYKNKSFYFVKTDGREVRNIVFYDKNHLFFSTQNGISRLNTTTFKAELVIKNNKANTLNTSRLFLNKRNELLWIGTVSEGLFYYDLKKKVLSGITVKNFPRQPILAMDQNNDSTLLVGIDGQGVWELSGNGKTVLNIYKENVDNPTSLFGDGVYDIFCDNNKRVWVSTYSGGLSFFEEDSPIVSQITHRVNISNSLSNNCINKILEDKRGNIWFATNNGISRWNPLLNQWVSFYKNSQAQAQVFLALAEDKDGNIWAGTYSSGVYVLDGASGREKMHFSHGWQNYSFSNKFIFDIFNDSQGDIWIGGIQSDLICYKTENKSFRKYFSQPVKSITELSPGKILLGCTYGLLLLDKEKGNIDYLLQGHIMQDILVVGNDIWIATCGDGLIKYDFKNRSSRKITTESGLPSNYVNSVISVDGYLWLGTESGLCRFNPADEKTLTFSSKYSLSNLAFNVDAKYHLRNGDLMFGTNSGAVVFNPDKLYQSRFKGRIFLQDIKISGRTIRENPEMMQDTPLNQQNKVSLKHDQNTLELELLPIGVSSGGFKFSWKMEGLDNDWSQPSNRKIITYTNLPSGHFVLKIKMYDSSQTTVVDERQFFIRIVPPFWETWWFRLLIFIILATIVYFLLKIYTDRLKQRHDEDKIRFFTTIAHDIRTSLTLVSAPIEELNKEKNISNQGRYYLNLATEQSGRLSFVATQLLDFQKVDVGKGQVFLVMVDIVNLVSRRRSMFEAAAKKKNIELELYCDVDSFTTAVDELKIEKVVDNLISNAIKYSHANSKIDITLLCDKEAWSLEVKDYGLGISENAQRKLFREFYRGDNVVNSKMVGSGIGLLLVKNYVSMHNGDVTLSSRENEGATFKITIPYKEVAEVSVNDYEEKTGSFIDMDVDFEHLLSAENENPAEKKIHVLIVEDNNDLQSFLKHTFEVNYKVSTANDGKQAWEIIQKKMPDFVVSDVMMPNMDGFELCKLIKSTFDTAHIPVILLTALSERTKQLEGLKLGADDYVTKPFDMSILMQRIRSIIINRDIVKEKALKIIKHIDVEAPILNNQLNDQFVKKALEVVRENISNSEFGKEEFASAMNASTSLLYKKIKSLTGQSPVDFIKIIRLDYSLELLQTRQHSVTEVSELCGFSSVGYFSTVFKKHFGKSPTDI
ncbi:MAG: tmoS 15 [Bacteroidetes bacterium]|nr:tmoS 15 [Bacteroidota bacterium]